MWVCGGDWKWGGREEEGVNHMWGGKEKRVGGGRGRE